ncbi:MAG: GEVED domain-containing protein, partial [Bacteroidota bacterium]
MNSRILLFLLVLYCCGQLNAQSLTHQNHGDHHNYVNELIETARAKNTFQPVDLFDQLEAEDVKSSRPDLQNALHDGTVLKPKSLILNQIAANKPATMTLTLPQINATPVTLELVKVDLFAPGFEVIQASTNSPVDVELGAHYHGRILGQPHSMAAISIFGNEISGMITTKTGNLVLGKLEGRHEGNDHILYHDADLKNSSNFSCDTDDELDKFSGYSQQELSTPHTKDAGDCVIIYIEVSNDITVNKGGVAGATSYTTALFNQSFLLYAAESINMTFGTIFVWDTTDPYTGSSSSAMLSQFQANTSSIGGATLGHMISYEASGGIAAGFSGVCNSNLNNSLCFSSIEASFNNVPTYSWAVMVVTHEMGHLMGSRHTHACVWNGNNTAIDGCSGATEGSCSLPGFPSGGGTIMSYCHLQSVGINFNNGFGPQPGAVIRNTMINANCTAPCADPTCDDGIQNGDETGVDCGGSCGNVCPITYCSSGGANSSFEWIDNATIGSINNTSGNNGGYGDYTGLSTSADQGATVSISVTPGFSGTIYAENWAVFADFNQDGDFDDAGESIFSGSTTGTETLSGSFTVPAGATLGDTRLRVVMAWNTAALSCGSVSYGETEDYTITVTAPTGPTCDDGIQNGNETGVDCGGPDCAACPTCDDGIQNGNETGVDCGGPDCAACPTCDDGIQNGNETGVDCGGPDCAACP